MTDDQSPEAPEGEGPQTRADLSVADAMALLQAGKEVLHVRITGLKFRGPIAYPVRFRNCILTRCEFASAEFADDVALIGCTLDRPNFQRKSTFAKNFDLSHTTVLKAQFQNLTVTGFFTAAHAQFRGRVGFTNCTFQGKVSFWEARFMAWVDFKGCSFAADADFRSLTAEQGFVLTKSTFLGDFLFRGSSVVKKFQADGSRFEKALDLSKAKLNDFTYLEAIEQGPEQTFAFLNAVAERIRVRPEQIEGRLASEKAGKFEDAMQEYGLLKRCYQALHRFDHEDWAFYRFKVSQRKAKPATWARPWTVWRRFADWLFLDVGCGYGTNPIRAVRMAVVIILGFALIYGTNVDMFYTDKMPFPEDAKSDFSNRIMIGLITSVSVFTSGMGGIREIAQGWMNVPVMLESLMGTLLFGLFIVAFSRKVIR